MGANASSSSSSSDPSLDTKIPVFSARAGESMAEQMDYIASNYILSADFQTLQHLSDKAYCDELVVLTSDVLNHQLTTSDVELMHNRIMQGQPSTETSIPTETNETGDGEIDRVAYITQARLQTTLESKGIPLSKPQLCANISKFYVKIAHMFAAIVMTINPTLTYTLPNTTTPITVSVLKKDSIPEGAHVEKGSYNLCDRRIDLLQGKDIHTALDQGDSDFTFAPTLCDINAGSNVGHGLTSVPFATSASGLYPTVETTPSAPVPIPTPAFAPPTPSLSASMPAVSAPNPSFSASMPAVSAPPAPTPSFSASTPAVLAPLAPTPSFSASMPAVSAPPAPTPSFSASMPAVSAPPAPTPSFSASTPAVSTQATPSSAKDTVDKEGLQGTVGSLEETQQGGHWGGSMSAPVTLEDEPGIPELMSLYLDDQFDYSTGTFTSMSEATHNEYIQDLRLFYTTFTGQERMPHHITRFSDIKLRHYADSDKCTGPSAPFRKQVTVSTDDDLFVQYADNLKNMVRTANANKRRLSEIINELFQFSEVPTDAAPLDAAHRAIRVHATLTKAKVQSLVELTRKLIVKLYVSCETNYVKGIQLYEAIVESKIIHTTMKQIQHLKRDASVLVAQTHNNNTWGWGNSDANDSDADADGDSAEGEGEDGEGEEEEEGEEGEGEGEEDTTAEQSALSTTTPSSSMAGTDAVTVQVDSTGTDTGTDVPSFSSTADATNNTSFSAVDSSLFQPSVVASSSPPMGINSGTLSSAAAVSAAAPMTFSSDTTGSHVEHSAKNADTNSNEAEAAGVRG